MKTLRLMFPLKNNLVLSTSCTTHGVMLVNHESLMSFFLIESIAMHYMRLYHLENIGKKDFVTVYCILQHLYVFYRERPSIVQLLLVASSPSVHWRLRCCYCAIFQLLSI